jgi:hypothetical protein
VGQGGEAARFGDKAVYTESRLAEYLGYLNRHPNPAEERKSLVLLRPARPWPAVVAAVNADGTADLDVAAGNGFTLHERGVPVDLGGKRPHSCRPAPGAPARAVTQEG